MRNQRNTSISMKHKLQFYLQMPYPLLSTSLPSVKRVSLFLSECLGKRSFNVNWTPSMEKHLCTLRALCHCAARGHAHPRGQRGWIRDERAARHPEQRKRAKKCLHHAKRLCQASPTTLIGHEERDHMQTLDCH